MVLGFGELTDDMRPDDSIYLDDEAIAAHFEAVKQRMDDKAAGFDSVPDAEPNELAAGFR